MVSGIFLKQSWESAGTYKIFVKKKMKQLLIPYLLWAIIAAFVSLPLILANNMHKGIWLWEKTFVDSTSLWDFFNNFFGILRDSPRQNATLWYVRALLILSTLAPVYNLFSCRRFSAPFYAIISIIFLFFTRQVPYPFLEISGYSIGWYTLGMVVREGNLLEKKIPGVILALCGMFWLIGSFFISCEHIGWLKISDFLFSMKNIINISGIVFFWGGCDYSSFIMDKLSQITNQTFFLYCMHFPIQLYFVSLGRNISRVYSQYSDIILFLTTIFCPFIVIPILCFLSKCIKKLFPNVYNILSGGR